MQEVERAVGDVEAGTPVTVVVAVGLLDDLATLQNPKSER